MKKKSHTFVMLLSLFITFSGCASQSVKTSWFNDQLYFGLSSPEGLISEADWQSFLSDTVTPLFPGGLSVWDAHGQWQDAQGRILHEPSRVLQLIHPNSADADRKIDKIIQAYKARFHQESVLKLRSVAEATF